MIVAAFARMRVINQPAFLRMRLQANVKILTQRGIMMRLLPGSFVFIALITTSACSGPRSPEGEASAATSDLAMQDLDKLHGAWRIESSMWNGVEEPPIAKRVK